ADEKLSSIERFEAIQELQSALRTNPIGIAYLKNVLATIKLEIQETGSLSERALEVLMSTIGFCDNPLMNACISLSRPRGHDEKGGACEPGDAQNYSAQRELAISVGDARLSVLELLDQSAKKNRSVELDAHVKSLALPDEGAT